MDAFNPNHVRKLIVQLKEGKEELFRLIVPQLGQIVKKVCADGRVSEHYEELLGAVYEKVTTGFSGFEGSTWNELRSWVWKISENATLDFINRTLKRMPPTTTIEGANQPIEDPRPPGQQAMDGRLDLINALEILAPLDGYILVLHAYFEYTFKEITRIVKLEKYAVHRKYWDAVKQLKERYNDES